MQVAAVATPNDSGWRWRIVNYAGEVIEESPGTFGSISAALTQGRARLLTLDVVDHSEPSHPLRRASHLRRG
jgi:hypothetical protein